jgi:hypothetical protein
MRDDIRSERLVAIPADCEPLLSECSVIGWDEDKKNPAEGLPDDCTHATYYAHRWQRHYGNKQAEAVDDSPAAQAQRFEDEMITKRLGMAKRHHNRTAALSAAVNRR